ncbi:MAG: rRNA pseudouridine synthase [Deltaproteobacteria bacterium]|jgi:23S rRNA pseudouridine2605 synthase|nr:rRNA pseudouridine synthase [Deltaproteobacteria bacterium]
MEQRLQKIIAATGYCSRRKAEQLIAAGRVTVNGKIASLGCRTSNGSVIQVDGHPLKPAQSKYYVLLHKPIGVVTSLRDPDGRPLVTDLVKTVPARLFPVGRLDLNTSGLLLLTNDGALANRLAHPRHEIEKTYLVRVRGHMTDEARSTLETGVVLDDGMTSPARVERLRSRGNHSWFEITIHEGRNRQVRRMCETLGFPVSRLTRIRYAFLTLEGLNPGQSRFLKSSEVARLRALGERP